MAENRSLSSQGSSSSRSQSETQNPARFSRDIEALRGSDRALDRPVGESPFTFMRRFMSDMDELFGDFGFGPWRSSSPGSFGSLATRAWAPQLDVFEQGKDLVVRADLPGIKEDDVNVAIDDGVLTISGERKDEQEREQGGIYHRERSWGSFQRAIRLPEGVKPDDVKASFEDGVLEVRVAKPEPPQQKGHRIPIGSRANKSTFGEKGENGGGEKAPPEKGAKAKA